VIFANGIVSMEIILELIPETVGAIFIGNQCTRVVFVIISPVKI
jgi:hypothetical protein